MDVTDHHGALDALHEASERAALITRHAGIGTWESGVRRLGRWDEQMFRLRGLAPGDAAPSREAWMALVHPDDAARVHEGSPDAAAACCRRRSIPRPPARHSHRWLASRSRGARRAGRPARRVGVNWDITENKNAALARQQAALAERGIQAKSQFLSRMSHELRTPLNAVLGFTQLLQIEASRAGQEEHLAKLEHIRAAGDHLLSLINDVLDLSALEVGRAPPDAAAGRSRPAGAPVAAARALARRAARRHARDRPGRRHARPTRRGCVRS